MRLLIWGAGAIGFLVGPLNIVERLVAIGAASLLVAAVPLTDELGLAAVVLFVVWHIWRTRQQAMARA